MDATATDDLRRAYRRASWGSIAGAWGAVLAFVSGHNLVDAYLTGRAPSAPWHLASFVSMAMWALYTPLLLWLGRRTSFEPGARARTIATHAAALAGVTLLDSIVQHGLFAAFFDGQASSVIALFMATLLIDGFSYVAVVAIGAAQRANARYRERVAAQAALDRELAHARLRALEMQLQPHFLFNTLHAVGALVRAHRNEDAVTSLATLGELLRATLAGDGEHEIALGDEADLARAYLALQQLRFGDRLRVELDVAADLATARVPRLILQPLLDNAIRHGVERSVAAVDLEVRARAIGDRLHLLVRDHGGTRGAPAPGQGIGLRNTRARLDALYGDGHRFELASTAGGGLEVRIELPRGGAAS